MVSEQRSLDCPSMNDYMTVGGGEDESNEDADADDGDDDQEGDEETSN